MFNVKIRKFLSKINLTSQVFPSKEAIVLYPALRNSNCFIWLGFIDKDGYGRSTKILGEQLVHRISWALKHGKIPKGKCILHKCDNRACSRHLFLGTHQDNVIDRDIKGRQSKGLIRSLAAKRNHAHLKGEDHGRAKLTNKQVIKIRKMYTTGLYRQIDIAELYHVSAGIICAIISRRTFKHI